MAITENISDIDREIAVGNITTVCSGGHIKFQRGKYHTRREGDSWGVYRLDLEGEYKVASVCSKASALAYLVSFEDHLVLKKR